MELEAGLEDAAAYASPDRVTVDGLKRLVQTLYRAIRRVEPRSSALGPLDDVMVDEFGPDEIWEQLETLHIPFLNHVEALLDNEKVYSSSILPQPQEVEIEDEALSHSDHSDHVEYHDDLEDLEDLDNTEHFDEPENPDEPENQDHLEGPDGFFDLDAMEAFADEMDEKDMRSDMSDSGMDLTQPVSSEDEDVRYDDFFDPVPVPEPQREPAALTPFQREQQRIREQIAQLEEENLADKEWHMVGEVDAKRRPADSLLEQHLDFDIADKVQAPITEESVRLLEDRIKQRIVDEAWDDVERVEPPKEKTYTPKEQLSSEKSKIGLADLYEQEYVEQQEGVTLVSKAVDKKHKEIQSLLATLHFQLDTLSNLHFIPTPARKEVEIRSNVPASNREEQLPFTVSTASSLAPEEVYRASNRAPAADSEKDHEERRRQRRSVKRALKHKPAVQAHKKKTKEAAPLYGAGTVTAASQTDFTQYTRSAAVFSKIEQADAHSAPKQAVRRGASSLKL